MAKPEVKSTNTKPKYAKTRGEHTKDLIIAILITGVIAFVGGMVFANKQDAEVKNAVSAAQQAMAPKADAQAIAPAPASK